MTDDRPAATQSHISQHPATGTIDAEQPHCLAFPKRHRYGERESFRALSGAVGTKVIRTYRQSWRWGSVGLAAHERKRLSRGVAPLLDRN